MPPDPILKRLESLYPPDRLLSAPRHLVAYESDGLTAFAVKPRAVVLPETAEEVVATVQLCHAEKIPFVARGSGTSLSGGSLPVEEGIVIGLNRLNRLLSLDPDQRLAVAEPGAINKPPNSIRRELLTRLDVSYVDNVRAEHITIERGDTVRLVVSYDVEQHLIGNIDAIVRFHSAEPLRN